MGNGDGDAAADGFRNQKRSAPSIAARSQTQPTPVTDATKPESEKLPGTAASACAL